MSEAVLQRRSPAGQTKSRHIPLQDCAKIQSITSGTVEWIDHQGGKHESPLAMFLEQD